MTDKIVNLFPEGQGEARRSIFTAAQFQKIDGLFLRAASVKALNHRTVECDFNSGVATYSYFKQEGGLAELWFVVSKKDGPPYMMYEVYKRGGRQLAHTGVFDTAYERLRTEIEKFIDNSL